MNGSPKFKAKQTPSRLVDRVPTGGSDSLNVNEHATGATLSLAPAHSLLIRGLLSLSLARPDDDACCHCRAYL